jgi:hypothetical protein
MWLSGKQKTTPHARDLDQVMADFEQDRFLNEWADQQIEQVRTKYPLLADAYDSPQSADKHAEGPFVQDHIMMMLSGFYALVEGRYGLLEIEEFARLKGYELEIEEMEQMIKERAAFFKAFILVHDIGKAATVSFSAPEGSLGAELGFGKDMAAAWDTATGDDRFVARKEYEDLYAGFADEHQDQKPRAIQAGFYKKYQISVSNHRHARVVFDSGLLEVIHSVADENRLTEDDRDLLVELVAAHMDPLHAFWRKPSVQAYQTLIDYSNKIGRDADDFLDLLQAATFLDVVAGTVQLTARGYWHFTDVLVNFLKSEHDWMPMRREQALIKKEQRQAKQKQLVYKQVGLDGDSLMELLKMTPGPEFGKLLQQIQSAVEQTEMIPDLDESTRKEVSKRIIEARTLL